MILSENSGHWYFEQPMIYLSDHFYDCYMIDVLRIFSTIFIL